MAAFLKIKTAIKRLWNQHHCNSRFDEVRIRHYLVRRVLRPLRSWTLKNSLTSRHVKHNAQFRFYKLHRVAIAMFLKIEAIIDRLLQLSVINPFRLQSSAWLLSFQYLKQTVPSASVAISKSLTEKLVCRHAKIFSSYSRWHFSSSIG